MYSCTAMERVVLLLLLAHTFAVKLPAPQVHQHAQGGLDISIEGVPGVLYKYITYNIKGEEHFGGFNHAVDGRWHHSNPKVVFRDGKLEYKIVAGVNGHEATVEGTIVEVPNAASALSGPIRRAGHTILRDDFGGSSLNTAHWKYEVSAYGGYNGEFQVYTNDHRNVYVKDGHLYIRPTYTADKLGAGFRSGSMDVKHLWGTCTQAGNSGCYRSGIHVPPIMSGKIKSNEVIRYGRAEIRAQTPCGDWIWPALWMLPRSNHYGNWPRSGEIDIMESRGRISAMNLIGMCNVRRTLVIMQMKLTRSDHCMLEGNDVANGGDGSHHGNDRVTSTLHWGTDGGHDKYGLTHGGAQGSWCRSFHTYVLDWTIDHIEVTVDGHHSLNIQTPPSGFWNKAGFSGNNIWGSGSKAAPFDHSFYFIMNVAVGGTNGYFSSGLHYGHSKPWHDHSGTEKRDFWDHRSSWQSTWQGENVAMKVDYIQMDQY